MICKNCASPINEGSSFCSVCGQKTENAAPAEVTPDTAPENIVAPVNNSSPTPASEPKKKDMSKLLTVIISVILSVIASVATTMIMNSDKKDVTVNNNNNTVYENEINEEDTTLAVEEETTAETPTEPTTEASIESLLIGEWKISSLTVIAEDDPEHWEIETLNIFEDGTCLLDGESGTWKVAGNELFVVGDLFGGGFWSYNPFYGDFTCDGATLKIPMAKCSDNCGDAASLTFKKVR